MPKTKQNTMAAAVVFYIFQNYLCRLGAALCKERGQSQLLWDLCHLNHGSLLTNVIWLMQVSFK